MAKSGAERVRDHRARKKLEEEAVRLGTLLANDYADRIQSPPKERAERVERAIAYQMWHLQEFGSLSHP